MKFFLNILLLLPGTAFAQLQALPIKEAPLVFGGKAHAVEVAFRNPGNETISADIRTRLYQASSATLMPLAESKPWKQLQVLAGQTVVETISIELPVVRVITEFRLRFSEKEKKLADVRVRVAPDDLLKRLSSLASNTPVGILDPDQQLKPLLKKNKVEFFDLEDGAGFDEFDGKLAIIGPFQSKDSIPPNLAKRVAARHKKPLAIVWIQSPDAKSDPLLPLYFVRNEESNVALVSATVVAALAKTPDSQLALVRAAEFALKPELIHLPSESQ